MQTKVLRTEVFLRRVVVVLGRGEGRWGAHELDDVPFDDLLVLRAKPVVEAGDALGGGAGAAVHCVPGAVLDVAHAAEVALQRLRAVEVGVADLKVIPPGSAQRDQTEKLNSRSYGDGVADDEAARQRGRRYALGARLAAHVGRVAPVAAPAAHVSWVVRAAPVARR